ncbi:MAG: Ldh family oxidoreductase [Pseudomonadota bacterium]
MTRYDPNDLTDWAARALGASDCDPAIARTTAEVLVEGDLLGHDTHGLFLLAPYLGKLADGGATGRGAPEVISDRPSAALWDGGMILGPWLTEEAIAAASRKARETGVGTVAIRRAGHIACLAAYLEAPARDGLMVEISSSDPDTASVAPFGGREAVFTPNPIAVGFPTKADPVMIDISASVTTNGMSGRLEKAGERFPHQWLLDAEGRPTDDPSVFSRTPKGTIQLLGGMEAGHKGYGLTLTVEAMTGGLAGYGRADAHEGWGATVTVRLTDPDAFGGLDAFTRQTEWIAGACRAAAPIDPDRPVRLPGERGLARKRDALARGLALNPLVETAIADVADRMGVPLP